MSEAPPVVGLIPAAGLGRRFGGEPKVLRRLGDRTVLQHAVERLRAGGVEEVVVAVAEDHLETVRGELPGVTVVGGGATRQESVRNCLQAVDGGAETLVVVHDAARPAVSPLDVRRVIEAVTTADGAVLGRRVVDTVKRLDGNRIVGTVDRRELFRAETPQVFRRRVLEAASEQALLDDFVGTDESSLVERRAGWRVHAVEAEYPNPKLTYRSDWSQIEQLLFEPLVADSDSGIQPA